MASLVKHVRSPAEQTGQAFDGQARVEGIQRARLVSAMVDVVCEVGVADANVTRVVTRAGVSRRTFYELFDDREECFLAALDDAIARVCDCVLVAYRSGEGWAERLRHGLIALLSFLDRDGNVGQLLIVESLGAGPTALARRSRVMRQVTAALDLGRLETKAARDPAALTSEGIVGAVLSIIHARMIEHDDRSLIALVNPLMSMIVLPYLGPGASRRELQRPVVEVTASPRSPGRDPLKEIEMRLTYRTVRVLLAIGSRPGASNREIGQLSDASDQGQISKLLSRLEGLGLVENTGLGVARGAPNAWMLTAKGREVHSALSR